MNFWLVMSRKQPTPPPSKDTRDGRVPDRSVKPATPTAPPNVSWVSVKGISEGKVKKGGQNSFPTSVRPDDPKGQSVSTIEQPKPRGSGTPISEIVARHVLDRMELGMKRYGEPLMANNGRDPLIDAYQEAHDLTVYLCQALVEKYGEDFEL